MNFLSPSFFFLFLPIFLALMALAQPRWRLGLMLAASLIFLYLGQPAALGALAALAALTFFSARLMERRRFWLWPALILLLGTLALFKALASYPPRTFGLPDTFDALSGGLIGLSYFAFNAISYLLEVWRAKTPAERNPLRLAAALFFFPRLVSGPLMRYEPLARQLDNLHFSAEEFAAGARRLLTGFIKRALLAAWLAPLVEAAFGLETPNLTPLQAWLALIGYALQLYFDFSGYSDMALGLAQLLGVRLPENFDAPYRALSVSDFWRRWHISLAVWFRENVFYPLERHRLPFFGQQLNILIVFALTGLWHGFKPGFLIWGLIHGLALALESLGLGRALKRFPPLIGWLYTQTLVLAGWVFFRSRSLAFALGFFARLSGDARGLTALPFSDTSPLPFIEPSFLLALAAGILLCLPLKEWFLPLRSRLEVRFAWIFFPIQLAQDALLLAFFVLALAALVSSNFAPNIYARF
ncbi:MAG: MBOAT family protein [Anaerolineales bacterium]